MRRASVVSCRSVVRRIGTLKKPGYFAGACVTVVIAVTSSLCNSQWGLVDGFDSDR